MDIDGLINAGYIQRIKPAKDLSDKEFKEAEYDLLIRSSPSKDGGLRTEEQNFCNSALPLHAEGVAYLR
ncbi:hypothetical protein KKF81_02710 [Candidatus Micrarchaeota archaeon]|nr:hypothetical protein [Candidatus Micrarchaeota archaeon]MBU1165833.1 hypothetical protein [Candidatus Micrarchaeota archaeon]MBU1886817.1 hypothetical protein [Candidatus Micrarchaeota archaeon]